MDRRYDPHAIEKKWQRTGRSATPSARPTRATSPSSTASTSSRTRPAPGCRVGHCRNYIPTDVACRYQAHEGLQRPAPDGLGRLRPARRERGHQDGRAIPRDRRREHRHLQAPDGPDRHRLRLVARDQLLQPDYYKWTQWIFLLLYKRGLAYRSIAPANWCPSCATVLANEEVKDGRCWRCDIVHREEGPAAVVLQDHRLRRPADRRPRTPSTGPSRSS